MDDALLVETTTAVERALAALAIGRLDVARGVLGDLLQRLWAVNGEPSTPSR